MNNKDPDQRVHSFSLTVILALHPVSYTSISGDTLRGKGEVTLTKFSSIKGNNTKINDPIWTVFKFIRDFIHIYLICVQKDPIKPVQFILKTKSNRDFFSNQENVTLGIMIRSG